MSKVITQIEQDSTEDIQPPVITENEETGATKVEFEPNHSRMFGTENKNILKIIIHQIDCLSQVRGEAKESELLRSNAMLAAVTEIKPSDTTELMLATQMVAVHELAMEMSKRALINNQSMEGVDQNINRVTKLMRTYTTQMEALNRYRTKGQQKITVQHVNVENGGQAIVGDINQGEG
ncbi:MAG: peptidyl-tRNA hydrolase [Candidatus Endobugula sp.]|jgi:peptidyl-tRNA hydrolase